MIIRRAFASFLLLACVLVAIGAGASATAAPAEETAEVAEVDLRESGNLQYANLMALSIEELLELRDIMNSLLHEKGYTVYFDLSRGDSGEKVLDLQNRLAELGFLTSNRSGRYDSATQLAQKQFERLNGLKEDGEASAEDQELLFSDRAIPKESPTPSPHIKPKPTATLDPKYQDYGSLDYVEYARNPMVNSGTKVRLTGRVLQVLGNRTHGFRIRLGTSGGDDVVYVRIASDPGYNILENDRLTVYGIMQGTITYESIWGQEVTVPLCIAEHIILH